MLAHSVPGAPRIRRSSQWTPFPTSGHSPTRSSKDLIQQLTEEEIEISYNRRILHGKIYILRNELVNRLRKKHESGQDVITGDDVQRLTDILAGRAAGDTPGSRRAPEPIQMAANRLERGDGHRAEEANTAGAAAHTWRRPAKAVNGVTATVVHADGVAPARRISPTRARRSSSAQAGAGSAEPARRRADDDRAAARLDVFLDDVTVSRHRCSCAAARFYLDDLGSLRHLRQP